MPVREDAQFELLMKTWDDGEAELVRQLLTTYGIPCQVVSDVPHSLFPLTVDGLGEVRILVPSARAAEARGCVADHLRRGIGILPDGAFGDDLP